MVGGGWRTGPGRVSVWGVGYICLLGAETLIKSRLCK